MLMWTVHTSAHFAYTFYRYFRAVIDAGYIYIALNHRSIK